MLQDNNKINVKKWLRIEIKISLMINYINGNNNNT